MDQKLSANRLTLLLRKYNITFNKYPNKMFVVNKLHQNHISFFLFVLATLSAVFKLLKFGSSLGMLLQKIVIFS